MNVDYATQTFTIPTNQPLYGGQQVSPPDSMSPTPSSASPTSPRNQNYLQYRQPNQFKQIKERRTPLYVPAALRPTERFPKQSPLTPPKSLHGSLDSIEGDLAATVEEAQKQLDAAMEGDYFPEEELGVVTGPPTKDHWKPDEASSTCDSPKCRSSFNLFVRKHHCRHCGHIFCGEHTALTIPLNQDAKFHPEGIQSRACDTCHRQYVKWGIIRRRRRESGGNNSTTTNTNTTQSSSGSSGSTTPMEDDGHRRTNSNTSIGVPVGPKMPAQHAASSVPRDWSWSTF